MPELACSADAVGRCARPTATRAQRCLRLVSDGGSRIQYLLPQASVGSLSNSVLPVTPTAQSAPLRDLLVHKFWTSLQSPTGLARNPSALPFDWLLLAWSDDAT